MIDERLDELYRQRDLVREHLAWLDREIEIANGRPATAPVPPAPPSPALKLAPRTPLPGLQPHSAPQPAATGYLASQAAAITGHATAARASTAPVSADVTPMVAAHADAILNEYRVPPDSLKSDLRKGCIMYFIAALALLAAGVTALYFLVSKH